jgi:hypothetical protein
LIATNRHVIGDARRIKVETSDGRINEVTERSAHLERPTEAGGRRASPPQE